MSAATALLRKLGRPPKVDGEYRATRLITLYARYFARKLDRFFLDESVSPLNRIEAFCQVVRLPITGSDDYPLNYQWS
jgi:hypothetical protein